MSEEQTVTIEVDGRELKAQAGAMLIDVTDAAGINIPRFCYHKKLSVAANCRMCLVEVAKVPKPLPACATPVADGMKVYTRSPLALAAQKGTMEFLLINHPLDCPICDQGGECELQDVALGYGSDVSRYVEGKRVVKDKDIGPLVATDLTRCIHCTRCVRFGAEIAGVRELGATGRGEHMTIGTYIEKSVDSELSGNIIDVCPVGSLTSKPFRFQARAWELTQFDGIAPHDSVGSNIHLHVRRNEVMRVHPKENEAVNECWISDRDRFSYVGLQSDERLTAPMIKRKGGWTEVDWPEALDETARVLKQLHGDQVGALASPASTLEELHLLQALMAGLGSNHVETRLRQNDFRGKAPSFPWLGRPIAELETVDAALLIGSNVRKEQPLLGHRLRKAALEGAQISYINPFEIDLNYAADQMVDTPFGMLADVAGVAKALGATGGLIDSAKVDETHQAVADQLKQATKASILLGNIAAAHPDYAILCGLAEKIAQASGATLGFLPQAANSVGAQLLTGKGNNAAEMLANPCKSYVLVGLEPAYDFWNPAQASAALKAADSVIALTSFRSPSLEQTATVMLPMAAFTETSGTFVNAEGIWQSFSGIVRPAGEARPGWKILRVLGNLLDLPGFEQESSEEVLAEIRENLADKKPDNSLGDELPAQQLSQTSGLQRIGDVPIYAVDPLVRRSMPLQQTHDAIAAAVYINANEAGKAGLSEGDRVSVKQDGHQATLGIIIDSNIPDGAVRIPAGVAGSETLAGQFGQVTLEKA
ncbi:MAG: NADH-quinone oxidoreductase subunit G [Sedimenticola sp.]|nr:MAG: NADH-quinone oxidoreductase subunit G [Sedimenticola sp.]